MGSATTCGKLMSLGVPKETSSNIITMLDKWVTNNGVEWTIDHLKDIKQTFIGKLAGVELPTKTWVKRRPDGYPAGPLTAMFVRQNIVTPRRLSRALTILTAHSMYLAPQCTERQRQKFFGSMTSQDRTGMESAFKQVFRKINGVQNPRDQLRPFFEFCVSAKHRAPGGTLATVPENDYLSVLQHAVASASVFGTVNKFPEIAKRVIPYDDYIWRCQQNYKNMRYTKAVMLQDNYGVISGIQEPGFKLRAVANPDRVIQAMLEPLKRAVMDHLETLPFDHTHDQTAAIPKVQEMLRSGERVHSVDLSDATNLFPLPLQVDLLRKMLPPQYDEFISIFERVSSGNWLTKLRGEPEIVRFSRGQPLGLGPSFGVFALAHGTLLEGLCERLSLKPEDHFVVLGDDVVIRGDALNDKYRASLVNLGCVVSESKTVSSTQLAEFAGYVILRDKVGKGYKWRDLSDHSFLDMVKNLGPSVQGFLHPWQREVVKILAPVPIQFGGLGWSGNRTLAQALELPITGNLIQVLLGREKELMLFRDPIPLATRVIYALQEESFLPYYSSQDLVPERNNGVSSVWPARVLSLACNSVSSREVRPEWFFAEPGDPLTQSYSLWNKPISDPRPGSLSLLKNVLGVDPDFSQNMSTSLLQRIGTNHHTAKVVFSTTIDPKPTLSKKGIAPRRDFGMS